MEKPLKDFLFSLYGHDSYGMYEVALAEYYYQINRCYDALTCVDSVLRVLQQRGNPAVLQAALFVQINVLVSKGQVKNLQVLVDDFEAKIQKINYTLYPTYIGAMRAWCSIYEGDSEAGEKWLKNHTFSDSDAVSIMDIFDIIVMLRINIQLGKYYLVASTAVRLMPILKSWHREMDLCNVKLLYALALFSDHNYEKAYTVLDETLPVVKRRRYYRLVSDEGEKMYHMLRLYVKDRDISDNCLDRLITMAKETGIMYPNYLRRSSENYPTLTETEKNVLRLMSAERTNAEIADYMSVSINTIKFHSKNIFMKLNASNRHQAIRIATQANII
jgi:LuxR family maltose regulon positive regulatory protein